MNILNQSDLSNRPVIKYIIIAAVAANAVILALLLFGPGRLSPAASPRNTEENPVSTGSTMEMAEEGYSRGDANSYSRDDEDDSHYNNDDEDDGYRSRDEDRDIDRDEDRDVDSDEDRDADRDEDRDTDRDEEVTSENTGEADTEESSEDENSESGPTLELVDDHVTLKVGSYFNFYEYIKTMKDIDGSDLSRYIHLKGEVNTYTPGDYTITYQITSPINGETASQDLLVTVEY